MCSKLRSIAFLLSVALNGNFYILFGRPTVHSELAKSVRFFSCCNGT